MDNSVIDNKTVVLTEPSVSNRFLLSSLFWCFETLASIESCCWITKIIQSAPLVPSWLFLCL